MLDYCYSSELILAKKGKDSFHYYGSGNQGFKIGDFVELKIDTSSFGIIVEIKKSKDTYDPKEYKVLWTKVVPKLLALSSKQAKQDYENSCDDFAYFKQEIESCQASGDYVTILKLKSQVEKQANFKLKARDYTIRKLRLEYSSFKKDVMLTIERHDRSGFFGEAVTSLNAPILECYKSACDVVVELPFNSNFYLI